MVSEERTTETPSPFVLSAISHSGESVPGKLLSYENLHFEKDSNSTTLVFYQ